MFGRQFVDMALFFTKRDDNLTLADMNYNFMCRIGNKGYSNES